MSNCALCLDPSANHTTAQHEQAVAEQTLCRECFETPVKDEDERCGECLSAMAEYFQPDEGGSD